MHRIAPALLAVLCAAPLAARAAPSLEVTRSSDAKRPFAFVLKGDGGEALCVSPGYRSAGKALKAAKEARPFGASLKNYLFQKKGDARGERHWWELRDKKKKNVLCTSDTLEDFAKVEHAAGAATKAFAAAQIKG